MKQLNWYQIFGKTNIPDGRTVLPTDDIQIWLHCANIWNKTYTTLAEVLADTDTLLALINSNNAVDYMVRSTTWAVAQALVPKMTSNTTPSGACSASSSASDIFAAYKAFDSDISTWWNANAELNGAWVQYEFPTVACVKKVYLDGYQTRIAKYKIQGSNGGGTFEDVSTEITYDASNKTHEINSGYSAYKIYRVLCTSVVTNATIIDVQFYSPSITDNSTAMSYIGLNNYCANTLLADSTWCNAICNSEYFESVLNVKVPVMTSNNTPEGQVIESAANSGHEGWRVFDGGLTYWNTPRSQSNAYVGYIFPASHKIYLATLRGGAGYNDSSVKSVSNVVQSYSSGSWVNISEPYSNIAGDGTTNQKIYCANPVDSDRTRLYISAPNFGTQGEIVLFEVQFYGREDV